MLCCVFAVPLCHDVGRCAYMCLIGVITLISDKGTVVSLTSYQLTETIWSLSYEHKHVTAASKTELTKHF